MRATAPARRAEAAPGAGPDRFLHTECLKDFSGERPNESGMDAEGFHPGIAGCAVLFGDQPVFFAEFHQSLDMLGDEGNWRDQDVAALFGNPRNFFFGRRAAARSTSASVDGPIHFSGPTRDW